MNETDWTKLAAAVRRGELRRFQELVRSATRTLIALAYRYTRDWETARDLTQETWIKVYKGIQRYDPNRPFRRWLYAIHRNTCLSHLRSAAHRHEMATAPEDLAPLLAPAGSGTPGARFEYREFRERFDKALAQLSQRQRSVVTKVLIDQLPQREAARQLGMSFTTLRTTLHFARRRLAGILRKLEDTP